MRTDKEIMRFGKTITAILLSLLFTTDKVYAQDTLSVKDYIGVTARPYKDSVLLRWAPMNFEVWRTANTNGYIIERFLMLRNGEVVDAMEKVVLNEIPIKPLPEEQWDGLVQRDRFSAIAAQAVYGDRFQVDLSKADVFTIINKVRENDQRYTFALFSADMSVLAAKASGLWFTDKTVKSGEKYLYRVVIHNGPDSVRGSAFVGPGDPYELPKPRGLQADFKDQTVSLRWERDVTSGYTAYIVERSTNGKSFQPISDTPLITVSPTDTEDIRYEYATDSIPDISLTYHYRVKGVSPFGETGIPSDVVNGKSTAVIKTVPYIHSGENINNTSILLQWEFPEESSNAIKGFNVERSSSPRGTYGALTSLLDPATRSFEDKMPEQINYYKVTAVDLKGQTYSSPIYLAQLIDSIPPAPPAGLKASVDDFGNIALSWSTNDELDMYGYRVYKSNTSAEEMAQITVGPIADTVISDKADLKALNETVYYSVMAIDRNQNHSKLSSVLKVSLPDKVKPQAPVFLPFKTSLNGVTLRWTKSSSTDVTTYDVYRRSGSSSSAWQRIKSIEASIDTIFQVTDEHGKSGELTLYTVIAIDEAGLESDPALPINAGKIASRLPDPVIWKEPVLDRENNELTLTWHYETPGIREYRLYKATNANPSILYKTLKGDRGVFKDRLTPGNGYTYWVLAIFENNKKSKLSEEITIEY